MHTETIDSVTITGTDERRNKAARTGAKTGAGWAATAARIALGLIFCLSGVNHLLSLIPLPPMGGDASLFYEGLRQTGYFFPLLGLVEVVAGALALAGRGVPLALVMMAPVVLNLAAFHAVLARQGLGIAVVVVAGTIYLARRNATAFRGLFVPRAARVTAGVRAAELVLGLAFVASGVAALAGRTPAPSTVGATVMMHGLDASGYFLPALAAIQVIAGGLLIARRFVGLALIALAPIVVEILAYRLFVASASAPRMLVVAVVIVSAHIALTVAHRKTFVPLVTPRV